MGNAKQELEGEGYDEVVKDCLSMWVSLLDNREKCYEGCKNESVLKDHVQSLKKGLEFLGKLYTFSTNRNLARSSRQLATKVKRHSLSVYGDENEDLRRIMMNLVNIIKKIGESRDLSHNYRSIIDLLLEYISDVKNTWYNNRNASSDDQTAALEKKHIRSIYTNLLLNANLDSVINKAAVVIYLLFVDKLHKKTLANKLNMIMGYVEDNCREFNIYVRFLKFSNEQDFSSNMKGQFYILDNLIHMLAVNSDSLNDANNHLYEELKELRTFVASIRGSKRLNHYLGLTAATESLCYQAEPIVSSCYMEEVELEEVFLRNLNDILLHVIGQIKMIKRDHVPKRLNHMGIPKVKENCLLFQIEAFLSKMLLSTSSHVHSMPQQLNNVLVGFSKEIDSVRNFLSGENDLQTISIVGMAGAGKTSLAKHVFNESSVDVHFDRKAWCTASQSYQRKDLLLTILKQINPVESDVNKMDDQELADKLCRSLKRRYSGH
ncbi:hypothetical protein Leryth_024139 [Lithospermum erythrorhizon]|nr:hypothetical protein Leryth_024139 [Lithospermum erythrorhizon]